MACSGRSRMPGDCWRTSTRCRPGWLCTGSPPCSTARPMPGRIGPRRLSEPPPRVVIMGGGDVIGQALERGLVDELRLHLAPMVLGGGTPLFKPGTRQMYRQRDVRPSRNAVHLTYQRM